MKAGTALKKYYKKRNQRIHAFMVRPRRTYSAEHFHELRVEIKKLNALFNLVNFCVNDFRRKTFSKPFKDIFRQAGKVREIQLEEKMLKEHISQHPLKDYLHHLKNARLREQEDFFSLVNKKLASRQQKNSRKMVQFLDQIHDKEVNRYMEKKIKEMNAFFRQKTLQAEQIHELRKRLKEFYYNRKILSFPWQNKLLKKTDAFQELLGKWHDCRVTIAHLQKAIGSGRVSPVEMKYLKKIKSGISSDAQKLLKKINASVRAGEFTFG